MALPIFAITLFVSAFLLFLVQPMIGKLILPKLGGTPQVWNTCMVFFQSVLLLGYAYTHAVSTKLKLRQQLMVHCALLVVPVIIMLLFPFYDYIHAWPPPTEGNPIPATLLLLAIVIGIPFFVVSTSAPLLQRWFAYSGDPAAKDPYFLYGASNLGSLLSLFFYPAIVEPWTVLPMQSHIWFGGYLVLAGLVMYCAYKIYNVAPPDSVLEAQANLAAEPHAEPMLETPAHVPVPAPAVDTSTALKAGPGPGGGRSIQRKKGKLAPGRVEEEKAPSIAAPSRVVETGATAPMSTWRRIRWILLAAVPSSLMLGVTSFVSTDLSPFPLVWVVPLALYLLSFILVYMKVWTGRTFQIVGGNYTLHDIVVYLGQPLGIVALCFIVLSHRFDPFWVTFIVMLGFFATALACHGELAKDRPSTKHLTEYFLLMSVGGMLGGLFNAIIAPVVFQRGVWEFHICIIVACMVRPQYVPSGWFDDLILNAFPGLQGWSRTQGDEMAKSMGRPAPRTTYLFSLFLDVIFGVFILSIAYWLATTFSMGNTLGSVVKFLQVPPAWTQIVFNIFVYFIPMVFCFFFAGRPLRLSLAVTGLLLGNLYFAGGEDTADDANVRTLEARRTYFGLLRVRLSKGMERSDFMRDPEEIKTLTTRPLRSEEGDIFAPPYPYTFLMHGTTYHGRNYKQFVDDKYKDNRIDLSRLATTYYHRYGPVGIVMEQYNWWSRPANPLTGTSFPGRQNDYSADMRMPVSLIGQMTASLGVGAMPLPALVDTWSEPPLATIGLGTGTMVSYARPYGSFTYYEIDEVIRHFSLPEDGAEARFTFLQNAIRRGVNMEVIMGDARQSLEYLRESKNKKNSFVYAAEFMKPKIGDAYAYADALYNHDPKEQMNSFAPDRNNFYKVINVDAFSSDAIPVHLVTKQAIKIYMDKLTEDGVLCVHTSNRHMDLVRPVARIALALSDEAKERKEMEINCLVGKDSDKGRFMGHFSSEYVMIFRGDKFSKYVEKLAAKKKEFVNNYNLARKGGKELEMTMRAEGKLMMHPDGGSAPDGWQILNSGVEWYDPYKDHVTYSGGQVRKTPITREDSIWTDDYTSILPLLR